MRRKRSRVLHSARRMVSVSRHGVRPSSAVRRGIATIWVILSLPTALILLITVVEIGNLWTVRTELQTNLEAAALAAVKTWGDLSEATAPAGSPALPHPTPGAFATTSGARDAAVAAFAVNSVNGQFFTLDRNEVASPGDGDDEDGFENQSCTGDIILGGFPTSGSNTFTTAASVGCGRFDNSGSISNIDIDVLIDTAGGGNTTFDIDNAFQITFVDDDGSGASITQIVIDLQHDGTDDGVFQFLSGTSNPVTLDSTAVGGDGDFSSTAETDGNGPFVHGSSSDVGDVTFTLSAGGDVLTIDFDSGAFTNGETLAFGIDTDGVGTGGATDRGGDFGKPGAAGGGGAPADLISFSFGLNGSPAQLIDRSLQASGDTAELKGMNDSFSIVIDIPDVDFAVLCQKTIQISSITENLFGISLGQFGVSGRAVATARCEGAMSEVVENPLVVHVTGVTCSTP